MDFKKTRGGFRQQQNCVWFQHWIHGKLLYINVGKFVSGLPNLYQTGPNRVYIRPWRKHKFMHSVYTMWNINANKQRLFQLLCIYLSEICCSCLSSSWERHSLHSWRAIIWSSFQLMPCLFPSTINTVKYSPSVLRCTQLDDSKGISLYDCQNFTFLRTWPIVK